MVEQLEGRRQVEERLVGTLYHLVTNAVSTNLFQYFGIGINRYVNK